MSDPDPKRVEGLEGVLPQTQCTKCGYPSCRDYAQALALGEADINQCPPGGDQGIRHLAALLDRPYKPLNPIHGAEAPRRVALIDEKHCIGCTLCIQACPVDAIIGGPRAMHTVLTALCTGCDLCLPPCPVDCIAMVPAPDAHAGWDRERAQAARARFSRRQARLSRERCEALAKRTPPERSGDSRRAAIIEQAMRRARLQRQAAASPGKADRDPP